MFVKFRFNSEEEQAIEDIVEDLRIASEKKGGLPSWIGIRPGNIWAVKGKPWREVSSFHSETLQISDNVI